MTEYFKTHYQGTNNASTAIRPNQNGLTNGIITEIGIERTACPLGTCPDYTFIIKSDGTFRYKGEKYVEHIGKFSGSIPMWRFNELVTIVRNLDYPAFRDEYGRDGFAPTDQATSFTMVRTDGRQKIISDYAERGPEKLRVIERRIDELMRKIQWKLGLPDPPHPTMPLVTRFDSNAEWRKAYLDSYRQGYLDGLDRDEQMPVRNPVSEEDKAKALGYGDGMLAGRAARTVWLGTNAPALNSTNAVPRRP